MEMKRIKKTGYAVGVLLTATGILVAANGYMEHHRLLEAAQPEPAVMSGSLAFVEAELEQQQEAEETAELEQQRVQLLTQAQEEGSLEGVLDYAEYQVQASGDAELDALVQELIADASDADMSRSEQLQACYVYMIRNYSYGYNYNYSYGSGTKSAAWAKAFLRDGYGACNNWSAAFVYVARALGYNAELYYGATAASGGGSTEHYWPVITIEGTEYVFDPQVESDMTRRSGTIAYQRYGLTGSAADAKYYYQRTVE